MVCLYCSSPTQVVNSRHRVRANDIWRRRKCTACASIFTTEERPELGGSLMVRHSVGDLEPFTRDKLFLSIYESCKHRTTALTDATALTQIVLSEAVPQAHSGVLPRNALQQVTHTVLRRMDPVAATLYVAYHPAG